MRCCHPFFFFPRKGSQTVFETSVLYYFILAFWLSKMSHCNTGMLSRNEIGRTWENSFQQLHTLCSQLWGHSYIHEPVKDYICSTELTKCPQFLEQWSLQCFFPEAQEHCCTLPWLPAVVWAPSGAHRGGCVSLVALLLQLPCTKKQVPITSKTQTQCWLCKYPFFNLSLCLCLFFQVYFQLHTKLHGIFRKL